MTAVNLDIPIEGHDPVLPGGKPSLVSNAMCPAYNRLLLLCLAFDIPMLPLSQVSEQNPGKTAMKSLLPFPTKNKFFSTFQYGSSNQQF